MRAARVFEFPDATEDPPAEVHHTVRGAHFLVVASHVARGTVLTRSAAQQPDEYMLLLPEGMAAAVDADGDRIEAAADSLTIVPPGDSRVTVNASGWLFRVFTSHAEDLAEASGNAADYGPLPGDVAPLETWPEPVGGFRLRHYRLAEHVREWTRMRVFRTCRLMVGIFVPRTVPRDARELNPHAHASFEQATLILSGRYVHHLRYPWGIDMTQWRDDAHIEVGAPSLLLIPPRVVHTSQAVQGQDMRLVDIFAPPRDDFSLQTGLVCNADDYPLPQRLRSSANAPSD